jgi:CDP-diacylglycerol--serine O-phosphatidyltransferase
MLVFWNALLFVLPVVVAGISFIFVIEKGYAMFLDTPIDRGVSLNGFRLFGDNKTWRGFVLMPLLSGLVSSAIYAFHVNDLISTTLPYMSGFLSALLTGVSLGFAYSLGELPNSFFKRQCGIDAGQQASRKRPCLRYLFVVFDIMDSVVAVAVAGLLLEVKITVVLNAVLLGVLVHIITDFYMFRRGLKSGSFLGSQKK